MRADGGVQSPRSRKALAPEFVPRNMRDLLYSVMREVKTGQTRLAVYLRGWCTLRPHYEGNAPPSIKPCISTAKNRGTKEVPPRIGLFPCLPVKELGNSLEDRYVNFILGNIKLLGGRRKAGTSGFVSAFYEQRARGVD